MKALFLIFHGFEEFNGISKKIRYQVRALQECGVDVRTCYLSEENGHKKRMIDQEILQDYGSGLKSKILKRAGLKCIVKYVAQNNIKFIYIRSDHNTTPFLIFMLRELKRTGVKILMEIPTYPYDLEYKGLPFAYQWVLFMDKILRNTMAKYLDKIVTFSDHKKIFGCSTIQISNGIDFNAIKLKKTATHSSKELHLIAVATIHPWHGFDRIIKGIAQYYKNKVGLNVYLHIVGQGVPSIVDQYRQITSANHIEKQVFFHGPLFGESLDEVFDQCDLAIGSLARHRSGITHIKTLKNREYAARGIPFIYSEIDDDFEAMPYILKVPADESPIDIDNLITFYHSIEQTPIQIRESIEKTLSWKTQMQLVINGIS